MSVQDQIKNGAERLTKSERKLVAVLLSDYPYAGLGSIQDLADHAEISAPSISRFVTKIGFSGFQDFQRALISEIKEDQRSPVELNMENRPIVGDYLDDFIARASKQMAVSSAAITDAQFTRICSLLMEPRRDIYIRGSRISDSIAYHLSFYLRQMRKGVYHLPPDIETWPEYLLRMKQGDVLFAVDFRRYQSNLLRLCQAAHEKQGARVIVMTDKWLSPIAKYANEVLPVPIESGTLWETYTPALAIIEAISTKIAEDNFEQTRKRVKAWDSLRLFEQDKSS